MTDVYVAYAREDRDRLRLITEMLRFEGWDLWMDPFDLSDEPSPAAELKLASARVILAFWSDRSRTSEIVRSEAATGLYKNKLMQLRVDSGAPPRPFDQVESLDFAHWRGDIDDPIWRRLIAGLKHHAGEPAGTRALPIGTSKVMAPPPSLAPTMYQPRQAAPPARAQQVFPPPQPPLPQPQPPPPPVFQTPPPVYQMPPVPPPVYQMAPPPPAYQPLPAPPPPQPIYQQPPPAPPPAYQLAQQSRGRVYDLPPAPPPLPPLMQPPEQGDRHWRQSGGGSDFGEPRSAPGRTGGSIGYAETSKGGGGMGLGPVAAAAILIVSGVGLWFGDPFGWRTSPGTTPSEPVAMAARTVSDAPIANGEPITGVFEDSEQSNQNWTRVNRKIPEALRDHVSEYPRASTAEQARSLLRVLDAQAWVTAVTADNDTAYQAYLNRFPADGAMTGAMAGAARDRLASLGSERQQAIEEIQRGLAALDLYDGAVDGKGGVSTTQAMTKFANANRRSAPSLSTSSPRELRVFAESMRRVGSRDAPNAEVAAASEADSLRVAQAQALAAKLAVAPAPDGNADALALGQQQRLAEAQAWNAAEQTGSVTAMQAYLAAWPNGRNVAAARAALTKLNRPAPYSLDLLSADVRTVVDAARKAQATANQKAAAARQAASAADGLVNAGTITAANGDRFVAQIANGAPNGVGLRVRGSGVNAGDRYRGELRNGQSSGVGVYEFGDNPGNAGSRGVRYEGEHAADAASGYGVFLWRSGDSLAGNGAGVGGQARGVLTYENGQRYEGDMSNGQRDGIGAFWGSDGVVLQAGRWAKDALAEPMKAPALQQ